MSCYLKPPFSVSCAQLQSSVERPCPGQNVTFTCTIPSLAHWWEVPSLGITPRSLTPSDLNGVSPDPPFQFAVIEVIPGTSITSTATVTATANLNGTNVFCRDGNLVLPDPQNATIVVIGSSSAPEVQASIEIPESVNIQLIPPVYGAECVSGYTIVYNGNHSTFVTGTSTTINNLDPCFQGYNFTAFGVTPGVPNGSSSEPPVVIGSAPDPLIVIGNTIQGVCPDLVTLTWNHPSEIPQCTNYRLDITTENGNRNTSVTGTSTTINILSNECCLRHTFTITPVYAIAGPRDTSDPVSLIPAENGMKYVPVY